MNRLTSMIAATLLAFSFSPANARVTTLLQSAPTLVAEPELEFSMKSSSTNLENSWSNWELVVTEQPDKELFFLSNQSSEIILLETESGGVTHIDGREFIAISCEGRSALENLTIRDGEQEYIYMGDIPCGSRLKIFGGSAYE